MVEQIWTICGCSSTCGSWRIKIDPFTYFACGNKEPDASPFTVYEGHFNTVIGQDVEDLTEARRLALGHRNARKG